MSKIYRVKTPKLTNKTKLGVERQLNFAAQ